MKDSFRKSALISLILLTIGFTGWAQTKENKTPEKAKTNGDPVKAIEKYAGSINKFIEKEKAPHFLVADVADYDEDEETLWKTFASKAELEKASEIKEIYTTALVWQRGGKTVAVNASFSSASGDWAQFVLYIYRADGTLAKVDSRLNTFYGDASILKTIYFDAKGDKIKETVKYRDLQSEAEFDPKERDFYDKGVEIYKSVAELPFAGLLETPVRKK